MMAVSAVIVVMLSVNLVGNWSWGAFPDAWDVLLLAVALFSTVYSFLHIRSIVRKGCCAAVSPAGVFVRNADIQRLIAWDEIRAIERVDRRVTEERDEYIVRVKIQPSPQALDVDKILSSEAERTAFIEAVEAGLQDSCVSKNSDSAMEPRAV